MISVAIEDIWRNLAENLSENLAYGISWVLSSSTYNMFVVIKFCAIAATLLGVDCLGILKFDHYN